MRAYFTITLLCKVAKVSRQSYYVWLNNKKSNGYSSIISIIKTEQLKQSGSIGYRKMKILLHNEYRINIGKNKVLKIMHENDLLAKIRRKKIKYGLIAKEHLTAPNILKREFHADNKQSKLAVDITYIPIPNSMVYMASILDMYNNELIGYKLSQSQNISLTIDLVNDLCEQYALKGSLLHSDQGVHFTNKKYVKLLKEKGIVQSMSRKGNCWDNAVIESFFGHFKCECIKLRKRAMKSFQDVEEIVAEYIDYYNNVRPQSKLGGLSPVKYRLMNQKI